MDTFLAFVGIALIVIVTPGPDTAVTTRNVFVGGMRAGVFTSLGVTTGLSIWALAASAGITALLVASEPLFFALKLVGGAYLVWLGIQSILSAFRAGDWRVMIRRDGEKRRLGAGTAYRQGLLSDLSNPKIAAFFTSLLPQFVPQQHAAFHDFAVLGLTFAAITLVWLVFYSWLIATAGNVLARPRIRRILEAVMGAVLIALGIRLAADRG
ncbi:MAG: LysE family translocator [Rhodospirillaceae bacterium]|nr:LysE family translocator [Rhodospirillaceae bacterium]